MKRDAINIIIVDDDATNRKSLVESVKRFGFKPSEFSKPDDALNAVKIKPYHAAIIDCMLPKMNGVDLAKDMRKTRFGNAPIVLISGVFRDKNFANSAIEKTSAKAFLNKPISPEEIKGILEAEFKELLDMSGVPLQVLVSKPFASPRERTKVIEGLEEVRGFDLPFILCVLMDANVSGHVNIANIDGQVYGISLKSGKIVNVDSSDSEVTLTMLLLDHGYMSREDLRTVRSNTRGGDLLSLLIDQQYLSPHVLPIIRKEQVTEDLHRLFVNENFKINFVPEANSKEVDFGFELEDLTPLIHDITVKSISLNYLKVFYKDWNEFPVQVGGSFREDHSIFQQKLFQSLPGLAQWLAKGLTIDEIKSKGSFDEEKLYKALHLLAFRRLIIFDDVKKVRGVEEYGKRMELMYKELQGKNPFQVFQYFGIDENVKSADLEKIYREFAKANHPDLLPPTTNAEQREAVNRVFSIVSEAYTTLSSSEKRQKLVDEMKGKEAEKQIQAEALAEEALNYLKRGKSTEAYERTSKAIALYQSKNVKIAHVWALLKTGTTNERVSEATRVLDSIPHEERRIPHYLFVSGLLKMAMGDAQSAGVQFDKAISLDPNFLEARREKATLTGKKKQDTFTADLTELVGNFFKKK